MVRTRDRCALEELKVQVKFTQPSYNRTERHWLCEERKKNDQPHLLRKQKLKLKCLDVKPKKEIWLLNLSLNGFAALRHLLFQ